MSLAVVIGVFVDQAINTTGADGRREDALSLLTRPAAGLFAGSKRLSGTSSKGSLDSLADLVLGAAATALALAAGSRRRIVSTRAATGPATGSATGSTTGSAAAALAVTARTPVSIFVLLACIDQGSGSASQAQRGQGLLAERLAASGRRTAWRRRLGIVAVGFAACDALEGSLGGAWKHLRRSS